MTMATTHRSPAAERLRSRIVDSLQKQGFRIRFGHIVPPGPDDKNGLRRLHREAVKHNVERSRSGLARHEDRLLSHIAAGRRIVPDRIRPRLVLVQRGSEDELLFRYARLHWSIPVSAGYGRRLRFVVYDESNEKLIGIFGLGDPVFGLRPRDQWIGWGSTPGRCGFSASWICSSWAPYRHIRSFSAASSLPCWPPAGTFRRYSVADMEASGQPSAAGRWTAALRC